MGTTNPQTPPELVLYLCHWYSEPPSPQKKETCQGVCWDGCTYDISGPVYPQVLEF